MRRPRCLLGVLFVAAVVNVLLAAPGAPGAATIADQGWTTVTDAGTEFTELRALVTGDGPSPLSYQARFTLESCDAVALAKPNRPRASGSGATGPHWQAVQTAVVSGGPAEAGSVDTAEARMPAECMQAGKAYRFRAELLEAAGSSAVAQVSVTSIAESAQLAFPTPAVPASPPTRGDPPPPVTAGPGKAAALAASTLPLCGSGTMQGTHEVHRVNGEWVEHGEGVIDVSSAQERIAIQYTYDAHGASAASPTATATGTGCAYVRREKPIPVTTTPASANMTHPGNRQQSGDVVTRTGATATGVFQGARGTKLAYGTLSMTQGTQALNLTTGLGAHSLKIRFTASE